MTESIEIMTCTCGDHVYTPVYVDQTSMIVKYIGIKIDTSSDFKNNLKKCFNFLSNDCKISYRLVTTDFVDPDCSFILLTELAERNLINECYVIDIGVFL